jgi:hypothetical protein
MSQSYYNYDKLGRWVNGYIIKTTNDTVKGKIAYQHYAVNQSNISFSIDGTDEKTIIYRPNDLLGFWMEKTFWMSTINTKLQAKNNEKLFVLMVRKGPISLYEYYKEDDEASDGWKTISLIKKLDDNYSIAGNLLLGFKKKMSEYVSEYEDLAKKIANKEKGYRVLHINKIIDEYNSWYLKANPYFTILIPKEKSAETVKKAIEWLPVQTFEGVDIAISSTYRKEPTWSGFTEEDVAIAIDLKLENKSDKSFQQVVIEYKMLDADGNVLNEGKSFVGYPSFTPKPETAIEPNYSGVVKAWKSEQDENFKKNWVKTEYKIIEFK